MKEMPRKVMKKMKNKPNKYIYLNIFSIKVILGIKFYINQIKKLNIIYYFK